MKAIFYLFIFFLVGIVAFDAKAQGCVAVKDMSSCSFSMDSLQKSSWQLSLNYRYFKSFRHFRGSHEEKNRVENGTEVINHDNSLIVGVSYVASSRLMFSLAVPLIAIDRSSLYEHYGNSPGNPRFHTQSKGFGDIRIAAYYSFLADHKLRLTGGLGFKLPTGNYRVRDYFHDEGSQGQDTLIYKVVDQSIQLGDGGLGAFLELDATYKLNQRFSLYATGFYLFNPRNTNGIARSSRLSEYPNGTPIPKSNEFSVPDQYLIRAGARHQFKQLQSSLGGRMECIPVHDILGREDGFRRPGYIISVEPSVAYSFDKHTVGLNVPIAVARNRTRSYIDIQRGNDDDGQPIHGDAAFADYLVAVSYAYRF